jgi:hypothetical protein
LSRLLVEYLIFFSVLCIILSKRVPIGEPSKTFSLIVSSRFLFEVLFLKKTIRFSNNFMDFSIFYSASFIFFILLEELRTKTTTELKSENGIKQ